MAEELKERFKLWLSYCLKFDKFKKPFNKMLSEMRPINLEKFKNFEEIEESKTKDGKRRYNYLKIRDYYEYNKEISLILGKDNTRYELTIVNRDLNDIVVNMFGLDKDKIDCDYVALLIINGQYMYEVDILKTDKEYQLVCREWNDFKIIDTQTKVLTEEQVNALLGKNEFKQL